jgi:hypothetical protein
MVEEHEEENDENWLTEVCCHIVADWSPTCGHLYLDVIIRKICFKFGTARGLTLTGEWRKLHNEELNDLLSSPNIVWGIKSRRMRWAGCVARVGERHRWEDNIKIYLQEVGCGGMDWIKLAQKRDMWRALVNVLMNLRVP